uniref:B(0,+)-type amino acid transporter 1 n=1 Tax=Daphnia galeata TaxID=27404 RepID=A0A8J2WJI5_9CRUS|nr:unnamed protein product [Daphnia galeata]
MENAAFDSCDEIRKDELSTEVKPDLEVTNGLELKRKVGLFSGVALIVGNMVGSGIFISPGGVLQRSGSVGLSLIMWAACGLLAIHQPGSLSYAELSTLIPKSGGEYSYLIDGLSPLHPFWGPLPAYLYSWISVLLLRPTTFAVGCSSCASYTIYPILASMGLCLGTETEDLLIKVTAHSGLITALNCYSVGWTIRFQNFFTVAKLVAIAVLIGCGIYQLSTGETQYLAQGFEGSTTEFGTIATAFYGGLWAYDGWYQDRGCVESAGYCSYICSGN